MQSKITDYIEQIVTAKLNRDGEMILRLQQDYTNEVVDLKDVGDAIINAMDDLILHIDTSQAITEARLRAIVNCLPDEIQENIYYDFDAHEDELFK
ncbi:hypothetical protein BigBertha_118 [Bacillus phage BigBertha]|uniref:Uncharacterized protein n=2 Tax=Bequatrovirus TaxID=1917990 RepID=A0A7U3T8Q7_9CAUD|nr:hypothetical protein BigBertha_118 [Bacillus phage BigBertha]AGY46626.1 hypothetical protein BigBertha_118 [Bacillus phage BigBertha]QPY77355.1 hypothetical protein ANTHOS_118 [Bacillus phage Anthos]